MTAIEIAAIEAILDQRKEVALRLLTAGIAWHALIAGRNGAATGDGEAIAKKAFEIGDAFLGEVVTRFLPDGIK